MRQLFISVFFGGIAFCLPLSASSELLTDSSINSPLNFSNRGNLLLRFGDSLRYEKLLEVLVEGTLIRSTSWEKQPYRTLMKTVVPATGSDSRTASELLMHQTGVMVQKTNHGGGSPTLRGLQGNQTLMMVDGIRLNNSIFRYGPNQYLNTLDAFALDQMEVLFGNGAVQYGSDAMGGVILAKFHEPSQANTTSQWVPKFFARGMGGSQELSSRGSLDYNGKKYGFTVGGSIRKFGDIRAGGLGNQLNPTGYNERNFDGKFLVFGKRGKWVIAHQNHNQFDVPVYHKVALENFNYYNMNQQLRTLTYVKKEWIGVVEAVEKLEVTAGVQGTGEWRSFQKNNSSVARLENDSVDTRFVTLKAFGKEYNGYQWVVGFDGYFDRVFSQRSDNNMLLGTTQLLRALYPNNAFNHQTSVFAYASKSADWGLLRLGGRYNGVKLGIPTLELGEVIDNNEAWVFDAAVSMRLNQNVFVYGNIGSSFRNPNIDDLGTLGVVDFRFEVPQFDLKPEYGLNKELGFKWKNSRSVASICAYHNQLSGLITRVKSESDSMQGYPVFWKQNVGESQIWGAECDFQLALGRKSEIKGGGFISVGQNITANEPMRRIPPAMFNLQWAYKMNAHCMLVSTFYGAFAQRRLAKGDIQDNRIGPMGTPGYLSADIRCKWQFKRVYLDVAVTNAGNALYKTHGSGVFMPGRSLQLMLGF